MEMNMPPKEVREIPLKLLGVDPLNVRAEPKIDDEFRKSIEKGIIEPLVVRPISSIGDKKAREELLAKGKQFAVTAGVRRYEAATQAELENVPCIMRELNDLEATALSIAENKHRKDIPPHRWVEIISDFYGRLEGTRDQRAKKISEMTGMGYSSVYRYLLLSEIPDDFKVRLKEPEERSFSEKELLAETSLGRSDKGVIDESGEEIAPSELDRYLEEHRPQVPERVMEMLFHDEDFKKLVKKDRVKAHDIATEAAVKGQNKVGEVLRPIREHPKREKSPWPPATPLVEIVVNVGFSEDMLKALDLYREEQKHPDLPTAVCSILLGWFRQQAHVEYVDLQAALESILVHFLQNKGYYARAKEEVKA
jgi:ParB family chromosome partitioning protein